MDYIARRLQGRLLNELNSNPIVFLNGPRQAGKSTLVQGLAKNLLSAEYATFDNMTQMTAAVSSPEHYLRSRKGAFVIDEVQLVPDVFRALKVVVDELRLEEGGSVKGRFLLTGSANIMALPKLSDPLVGRLGVLTLYPLAGAEVVSSEGNFIERLFAEDFFQADKDNSLVDVIAKATYPEVSGSALSERSAWFDGYLTTILQRDVRSLAEIEKLSVLPNLLRILAARSGGLINDADIARDVGLNPVTSRNYKTLLKMLFLTFEVSPWYRNVGKRLVKSSKGYLVDTLFLSHILQYNLEDIELNRPDLFGHVLENFVAIELLKLLSFYSVKSELYHFRTSDNKEVDFVIERSDGRLCGVEVKQSDNVSAFDFKGLKELQRVAGDDFCTGIILYRGREVVPFGEHLWAVPVDNLWL